MIDASAGHARRCAALAALLLLVAAPAAVAQTSPSLSLVPASGAVVATRWAGTPFLSPLEVDLRVAVRNSSTVPAANVVGTVTASSAPATILDGTASFGTVAPGATVRSTDTVTLRIASAVDLFRLATSVNVAFTFTTANRAPVAQIAAPAAGEVAVPVALDGQGSRDPDGDPLTYTWSLVFQPGASTLALDGTTGPTSGFTPDAGGTYRVRLVVSDGQLASAPVEAVVAVVLPPALEAAPTTPAADAIVEVQASGAPPTDLAPDSPIILSRIVVVLKRSATVEQVNAAAALVNGTVAYSKPGSRIVTFRVPRQSSATALAVLANTLSAQPGILMATPDAVIDVEALPTGFGGEPIDSATLNHLLVPRFPAAWNARRPGGCDASINVLVNDAFDTSAPGNFASQLPSFRLPGGGSSLLGDDHGYNVTAVLAAAHDDQVPTGAHPDGTCLVLSGLLIDQASDLLGTQAQLDRLAARLRELGRGIVNLSWGMNRWTPDVLPELVPLFVVRQDVERLAAAALYWAEVGLTREFLDNWLVTVAAGNQASDPIANVFPGYRLALIHNPVSAANAFFNLPASFGTVNGLWQRSDGSAALSDEQLADLQAQFAELGKGSLLTRENLILVGATNNPNPLLPGELAPAPFSNDGPDVYAVGVGVPAMDGPVNGSSFAAPTVAGLAAYLWQLSPTLRTDPAARTRDLILSTARPFGGENCGSECLEIIDAYDAVLALDRIDTTGPVRRAILDVNDDSRFDDADLDAFLDAYTGPGVGLSPDYSRHDLNGDGFTGGPQKRGFDLDGNGLLSPTPLERNIEGTRVVFDENDVTDRQVLCYYAYSSLFSADRAEARSALLTNFCRPLQASGGTYRTTLSPTLGTAALAKVRRTNGDLPSAPLAITLRGPEGWSGNRPVEVVYPASAFRWFWVLDTAVVAGTYEASALVDGEVSTIRFDVAVGADQTLPPLDVSAASYLLEPPSTIVNATVSFAPERSDVRPTSYFARVVEFATGNILGNMAVRVPAGIETGAIVLSIPVASALQAGRDYRAQVFATSADLTITDPPLPEQFNVTFDRAVITLFPR